VGQSIDVVAFDFDGTLADTTSAILATALQTLRELEHPPVPEERFVPMIGLPLKQAFLEAGVDPQAADACVVRYRERFPDHAAKVALFPAVRACLDELTRLGLVMGIVSSRGRASLFDLIERLRIGAHFRAVVGEEDVLCKKPEPEPVLKLAATLGVSPARVLVVGDTTYDIEMGHAAGAPTCAVTYGSHDAARLERARPTYRLDSLAGLRALLAR
jgi:HAD superfamily hydrolase (TIGR01509 family)